MHATFLALFSTMNLTKVASKTYFWYLILMIFSKFGIVFNSSIQDSLEEIAVRKMIIDKYQMSDIVTIV